MKLLKKIKKSNKKNHLNGGNTTNIHLNGKEFIEQALSNSSVENKEEENTKSVTLVKIDRQQLNFL